MYITGNLAMDVVRPTHATWAPVTEQPTEPAEPILGLAEQTVLQTIDGYSAAADLTPGDSIRDENGVLRRILKVSKITFSKATLLTNRALAPIRIECSGDEPSDDTIAVLVSPDQPIHVGDHCDQTLRADLLGNGGSIRPVIPDDGITYLTFKLADHATFAISGLRVRIGERADPDTIGHTALTWRQEEKRVFRPLR